MRTKRGAGMSDKTIQLFRQERDRITYNNLDGLAEELLSCSDEGVNLAGDLARGGGVGVQAGRRHGNWFCKVW